jgi:hypothetical protein
VSRLTVTRVTRRIVIKAIENQEDYPITGRTTLDLARSLGRALGTHPSFRGKLCDIITALIKDGEVIHFDATVRMVTDEDRENAVEAKRRKARARRTRGRRSRYMVPRNHGSTIKSSTVDNDDTETLEVPDPWKEFAGVSPDDPALLKACALVAA